MEGGWVPLYQRRVNGIPKRFGVPQEIFFQNLNILNIPMGVWLNLSIDLNLLFLQHVDYWGVET